MPPNKTLLFENFIAKYNKVYATETEKGQRFQIFNENVDDIYASNAEKRSYTLGITKNTDLTFEEWRASHSTGLNPGLTAERKERPIFRAPTAFAEPESVDWVAKGAVTSVKEQGTCGACWAFSAVGALEGAMAMSGRKMVELSVQHILACDTELSSGCHGGSKNLAFDWVGENGIPSMEDEPYLCENSHCKSMTCSTCLKPTGQTCIFGGCGEVAGSVCTFFRQCECKNSHCFEDGKCADEKPTTLVLDVGDVVNYFIVDDSEDALEAAVAQQPVSVAIATDTWVFQHYTSGVLTSDECGSVLNHDALVVGYGTDNGQKYWKVKNSWGTTFGEDGYIRIEKGKDSPGGQCGIRKMASFPMLKASASNVVV